MAANIAGYAGVGVGGPTDIPGGETDKPVDSYQTDKQLLIDFLTNFRHLDDDYEDVVKYQAAIQALADRKASLLSISMDDLDNFNGALAERVRGNTLRYIELAAGAVDAVIPPASEEAIFEPDVVDVLLEQRRAMHDDAAQQGTAGGPPAGDTANQLPPTLMRRWRVVFEPSGKQTKVTPMREIRSAHIGKMIRLRGIVTRVTAVRPLMTIATYTCDSCGHEVYKTVTGPTFMPLSECPSYTCVVNKMRGKLTLQTRGSRFVPFQEVRVQEHAADVPVGDTPRHMSIHVRGDLCRACVTGDTITVGGVFLPAPMTSFRRAGLIANVYVEAMTVAKEKKGYKEVNVDEETLNALRDEVEAGRMYEKLSRSIAPEIYGLGDIKKALLLQLVGGVTRNMADGMKIRGDINVCLVGDPGVAKSQVLKHVASVAPRGVYTSGKGASGVGLTAAVLRDPVTDDFVLEGGALVLADEGICCIDEFDKMEDGDRTAIHEVMEQQTISIAKAGINTTLNARTAVLAAANPLGGRYDPRKSILYNVNLPAALLSRFDLLYLLIDRPDMDRDRQLAEHILTVHRTLKPPPLAHVEAQAEDGDDEDDQFQPLDPQSIRNFISHARTFEPAIPQDLIQTIVDQYVELRTGDRENENDDTHTTARTLLSILRLSQAVARVNFRDQVDESDFDEAVRLMTASKASIDEAAHREDLRYHVAASPEDACWNAIVAYRREQGNKNTLSINEIVNALKKKSKDKAIITRTLETYSNLTLVSFTGRGKNKITFL